MIAALTVFLTIPPDLASWVAYRDDRLSLTGPEVTVESDDGLFLVHYTREGEDAASGEDFAGHPEIVWAVLRGLHDGKLAFEDRGYRALMGDAGAGGSNQIDVYIREIDANGYAHPEPPEESGDPGFSCWMEIDAGLAVGEVPESVTAHELHHCVQYRYTTDTESWLYEATATFEQYRLYRDPVLDLALGVLWVERLGRPDRPLASTAGRYEYAGIVFMKFWEEFGGSDDQRVIRLWEALADNSLWPRALDDAADENWSLSLDEAFAEYATWNAFACARDVGEHYSAELMGCDIDVSVPVLEMAADGGPFALTHTSAPFTASYIEFPADGDNRPVSLTCEPPGMVESVHARLITLDPGGVPGEQVLVEADEGEELTLTLTEAIPPQGRVLAVFASVGSRGIDVECTAQRVDPLVVEELGSCGCSAPAGGLPAFAPLLLLLLRRRQSV